MLLIITGVFGRIYGAPICFRFYLNFSTRNFTVRWVLNTHFQKLNNCVCTFIKQHEAAGRLQAGFYFIELQSSADTHNMNEGHMDTIQTLSCSTKGITVVSPMGGNQDTFSAFFLSLLPQSDQIGIM